MKNSYAFPKYSKKVLEAIDKTPTDNFLSFLTQYPSEEIVYKSTKWTKLLIKLGLITKVRSYTEETIMRAYKSGIINTRRSVENVLLRKYKTPKFCVFHNKKRKDCPCI